MLCWYHPIVETGDIHLVITTEVMLEEKRGEECQIWKVGDRKWPAESKLRNCWPLNKIPGREEIQGPHFLKCSPSTYAGLNLGPPGLD